MADVERQFEPAWEQRKQTETAPLRCVPRAGAAGPSSILFDGVPFPSLQHWTFGLIAKDGVTPDQLMALAAQIEELCDGRLARFDYQPEGLEHHETDKYGLAILSK